MGLFGRFTKKRKEDKSYEPTIQTEQTTKNVIEKNKETLEQKPKNTNDKPYDLEYVKKFYSERNESMKMDYEPNNNPTNIFDIENQMKKWEEENHPLTEEEKEKVLNRYIEILEEKSGKLEKYNMEIHRWIEFLYTNNQQALKYLENGDIEKATSILEENVTALADTPATYDYLVDIYRFNEDYDNELRICNQAIELIGDSKKREYYINRKEEIIKRKHNDGTFSGAEELDELIKREEKLHMKSHLTKDYYSLEYKEEQKAIENAKKEYLEKNPTNFLLIGTKVIGINWSSIYRESEDIQFLLSFAGEGKYLEEKGEYEKAIPIYEKANKIAQNTYYCNNKQINQRIKVCKNKVQKQKIKDLETKAKELEKTDPKQAIEIYNELNLLNPNLKKYDKRIEILNKKI